ncbi:M15 family metallopeptidase [Legionella brunensis]|uniref:D-alanyl-D-alanine dipeptidase n=1 Tax=Legionella brunensis TaxID=29422 RepID=A0A0W0S2N6_9GAMM|nr:M15 family metallopeptidase [Legionella brunensis]KTC77823.1 D-alanyl-D-alanine dipeptidase [Legionella brunensis]
MLSKKEFSSKDFEAVEFTNQIHPRILICSAYFEQGFSPYPFIFGRYAVLDGLLKALANLPATYGFLIWDVYRPREVQRKLFDWMSREIRQRYPNLNEQEHQAEVLKYVAAPAKIGDNYCSPHLSGGAIDLTLYDLVQGQPLDMGTSFDDCSEKAHSSYFDLKSKLSFEESEIKDRRDCLRKVMEGVGFVSYRYEWWHFDMGNVLWATAVGQSAVFGPLFGDKEWPL